MSREAEILLRDLAAGVRLVSLGKMERVEIQPIFNRVMELYVWDRTDTEDELADDLRIRYGINGWLRAVVATQEVVGSDPAVYSHTLTADPFAENADCPEQNVPRICE